MPAGTMPPLGQAMNRESCGKAGETSLVPHIRVFKWEINTLHIPCNLNYLFMLKHCQPKHELKRNLVSEGSIFSTFSFQP